MRYVCTQSFSRPGIRRRVEVLWVSYFIFLRHGIQLLQSGRPHGSSARGRNPWSILDLVVVIIKYEIIIGEVLSWVAGSPFLVHHLNVNKIVCSDLKATFDGTDTRESCGVVLGDHSRSCALIPGGLVDDLDRSDISKVGVGVNDFGNLFELPVGSLVLVVRIEPGRRSKLSSERLFSLLCTRRRVGRG